MLLMAQKLLCQCYDCRQGHKTPPLRYSLWI